MTYKQAKCLVDGLMSVYCDAYIVSDDRWPRAWPEQLEAFRANAKADFDKAYKRVVELAMLAPALWVTACCNKEE